MGSLREFVQASQAQTLAPGPVVLSPWPSEITALEAATVALGAALGGSDDTTTLERLGAVSAAMVERYAPGAPQEIRNEAVVRASGWLRDQPASATRDITVGPLSTSYQPSSMSALRHSGAMALLSPWKVRRAGAIG